MKHILVTGPAGVSSRNLNLLHHIPICYQHVDAVPGGISLDVSYIMFSYSY